MPRSTDTAVRNRARIAVLLPLVLTAMVGHHTPADAHPFGPPLRANVATEDDLVLVGWGAAEDDWVALGRSLGVLDGATDTVDPEATVPKTGFERIAESDAIALYLLDHIHVTQDGRDCEGEVSFPDDLPTLLATGALVQFTCPDHIQGAVQLTITALTDLHESYRTVSTAVGTDQLAVHTLADPTHTVDPDAEPFSIGRGHLVAVTGLAALLCLIVGLLLGRRGADPPATVGTTERDLLAREPAAATSVSTGAPGAGRSGR